MKTFTQRALVLGLLAATNPIALDMYLPALPNIAADLRTSPAAAQATIASYIAAVALSQLFYGPVSDMFGRRPPLFFGLGVFLLASLGCLFAPSIEWLIAFRFLQGLGSCAAMVISRAIIRDLHSGIEAARLLATVMLVFSVVPVLAPLLGSYLMVFFSWRGTFAFICLMSLVSLAVVTFILPETRPPEKRVRLNLLGVASTYRKMLADRRYIGVSLTAAFGMASFFAFLATSSFVYIDHFGLNAHSYSLAFSSVAIGFFGAAQFTPFWARRFGFRRVVTGAVIGLAATATLLAMLVAIGIDSLMLMIVLMIVQNGFLGTILPCTQVLALEHYGPVAGMAAGMLGSLQMAVGSSVMALLGLFFDGSPLAMTASIAACTLASLTICLMTLQQSRKAAQPAE